MRLEFVEMHANSLDLYVFDIVVRWLLNLNSLILEVYLNTPAIVCIRIYKQVIKNGRSKLMINMYVERFL